MLHILPLLLGAAISPVAAVGMIAVLTTKQQPRIKGFVYLLGASIPLVVIGVVSIFFFTSLSLQPKNANVSSTIDLVAGVLLLALAVKNFYTKPKKSKKAQHSFGIGQTILLGTVIMLTNFSTIVLFIPAMKDVAVSSLTTPDKTLVLLVSIFVTLSLVALPLLIAVVAPNSSKSILEKLRVFMVRHNKTIIQSMLIVFGIYLLAKGFGVIAS